MRGRICYTLGAVLYVASGVLHAFAHKEPPPPDLASVHDAMEKATHSFAGMTFTIAGAVDLLSWCMTIFSVMTGLIGLMLVGRCRTDAWLMRGLSLVLAIGAGAIAGLSFHYGVAPPAALYTATALLFFAAAVRAQKPAA